MHPTPDVLPDNTFRPSSYQQAIFDWLDRGSGNAIVSAVAGSGKTTTLVEAARRLGAGRLFFAAFNRHIVATLKSRLPQGVRCQTVHAVGFACLRRRFGDRKPAVNEYKYRSYCRQTAHRMHDRLHTEYETRLSQINEADDVPSPPPTVDQIYSQLDQLVSLCRCALADAADPRAIQDLVRHFAVDCPIPVARVQPVVNYILEQGLRDARDEAVIDFTDMIWLPHVWNLSPEPFDWIFVDEAQDLNAAQLALIRKMSGAGTRLLFVGDPRQAIYGFSGADSESYYRIRELANATEFPLSICYRCAASVVELAQGLVPDIEADPAAPQGEVQEIMESQILSCLHENDLVLSRSTEPLLELCLKLLAKRVRAYVKGKEIGESLVSIIEHVEAAPGFSFVNFIECLESYRDGVAARLRERSDSERQIVDLKDQIAGITVCYTAFNPANAQQLKAEIKALFSDMKSAVTLSTIHRAKGLENRRVFILDYNSLPLVWDGQKQWQFYQELNLKYVAITRARESLFLVRDDS